ncbi:Na+ dependent nucleoside transporter domain-containing protein [Rubrivirga sp. SAORIC476]|uniref:NupC/NupG family nucleoside CNT transporter n=1 Tax=Rubrivirga sp. SAORIC476 TaxID=1961794 RepID=UPI000BA99D67|nr:nucleoside transporter C-terminal domain-containing protein [Rubrivirga sp. SAORIC476]PAP80772.1 Na+ dependent nucleoside transporter domain-containing protein [Rubrivirga sp. SAORIC476]
MDFVSIGRGLLGLVGILAIAFALSSDRRRINWRTVGAGVALQLVFAILFLKGDVLAETFSPFGWPKVAFAAIAGLFVAFLSAVEAGSTFVFGTLALSPGADGSLGFFFFAYVLPTVIVFAAMMSILYYLGIMQRIVQGVAWVVQRALGTSGPESLSVSANIFVGQTEAPLVIKPYIKTLSRSELMAVMTGGMATIAGGVLASYVAFLGERYASVAGIAVEAGQQLFAEQLLGASVMAAPAALVLAKILIPETRPVDASLVQAEADAGEATQPSTASDLATEAAVEDLADAGPKNVIDAAATGAADGLQLALNIGAMLIAFLALIAMINGILDWSAGIFGYTMTLESILGVVLAPVAWLIGVPTVDITAFGGLIGTKVIANEFVAYSQLADAIAAGSLDPKTVIMATFALCGFANLSSIGIQIGGIGPLAPERTGEIASLGLRAVLAGTLANLMTATIAGVLLG